MSLKEILALIPLALPPTKRTELVPLGENALLSEAGVETPQVDKLTTELVESLESLVEIKISKT